MESLEHAMKKSTPIIAEYLGGAVNCDAYHMTDPQSDVLGVSSCIQGSLEDAGVSPEEVNYINGHATSTLVGDLAEVNVVKKVFKSTDGIKMNLTKDSIIVFQSTKGLVPWFDELKVVSHCLESIVSKVLVNKSKVEWSYTYNRKKQVMVPKDWWVEDLCGLSTDLYKRVNRD
ncbi:putative beta-ketoacyl-[acyl-carrier-protein] synthase I [Helianthus anomalus]